MTWTSKLKMTTRELPLLVNSRECGDVVKARLPSRPHHPRALLTMLQGLALWSGSPMWPVISADNSVQIGCAWALFGDELWPAESQFVRFEPGVPDSRKRLRGGDFRALRPGREPSHD